MNKKTGTKPRPQRKTRVLIVEDDENAALPMAELLEDLSCEALVCGTGDLALDLAQTFKPEIVLLDKELIGNFGKTLRRFAAVLH